jgi:hypothetical protein
LHHQKKTLGRKEEEDAAPRNDITWHYTHPRHDVVNLSAVFTNENNNIVNRFLTTSAEQSLHHPSLSTIFDRTAEAASIFQTFIRHLLWGKKHDI